MSDEETYVLLPLTKKQAVALWPILLNTKNMAENYIKKSNDFQEKNTYTIINETIKQIFSKIDPVYQKIILEENIKQ